MDKLINFLYAAILSGTPFMFGTLGEIVTEKVGSLNLGVEGMMAMGAIAGFCSGYVTGNVFIAVLSAFLAGVLTSLIYAVLTVTLKANQSVTGLTLTIFAVGLSNFIGDLVRTNSSESVLKLTTDFTDNFSAVYIPFLSDIPYIGKLLFTHNPFVYFGVLLCVLVGIYIKCTRKGLNMRSVGENPAAADAAGININLTKYFNIMLGGGICGIGGAYISLVLCGGVWVTDCIGGLGWIAVALVIFANWNPFACILGSVVFGAFRVLSMYFGVFEIPEAIYDMLPFLVTALVLIVTSVRKSKKSAQPAALGVNYFREER